jgi:DNA-binding response OmpR family regulator
LREYILIVDDERNIAHALTLRLEAAGYEVMWACDGASGVAAALARTPDAILLDIRMPDIDGFEVNKRLRTSPALDRTPIIFLSANVQDSCRQAALAAGAFAFLTKPYDARDVTTTIRNALDQRAELADAVCEGGPA